MVKLQINRVSLFVKGIDWFESFRALQFLISEWKRMKTKCHPQRHANPAKPPPGHTSEGQ